MITYQATEDGRTGRHLAHPLPALILHVERYKLCGHKSTTQLATLYLVDSSSSTMPCRYARYVSVDVPFFCVIGDFIQEFVI